MEFGAFYYISRQGSAVRLSNGGNRVFSIRQYKAVISFSLKEQILCQLPNSLSSGTRAALKLKWSFCCLGSLGKNGMEDVEQANISHLNNAALFSDIFSEWIDTPVCESYV